MAQNVLYLTVLPIVHLGPPDFGRTEQILTLFPDSDFATRFFPDEVESYITTFKWRAEKYLSSGHVTGYEFKKMDGEDGRVIVQVIQHVQ